LAYHRFNPKYNKEYLVLAAQRLAAQPLGRFRSPMTILTGNLKSQSSVLSLSLGQVGCSRGLGHAPKWDKRKGIYWFYLNYSAKITTSEARLLSLILGFRRGGSNFHSIIEMFFLTLSKTYDTNG
jgi:hypothetical protein